MPIQRRPRRHPDDRCPASQRGMTLIEVLVALLIFSFGVLGLVGLQGRAHSVSAGADDSNRAALLANEVTTSVVLTPASDGTINTIDVATATYWNARAASAVPNGSIVFGAITGNKKVLPITVYWRAPTAAATAASNTYQTEAVLP